MFFIFVALISRTFKTFLFELNRLTNAVKITKGKLCV